MIAALTVKLRMICGTCLLVCDGHGRDNAEDDEGNNDHDLNLVTMVMSESIARMIALQDLEFTALFSICGVDRA